MPGDSRLQILAVAHVALGVVTSVLAPVELRTPFGLEHIPIVPFFASALCQALLLSLWGAVSQAKPWMRLAGLVAGAVYLEALVPSDLRREFLGISTITIVVTTATLLVVRWLGVRLTRQDDPDQSARQEPEGLRFSIRGLMIFTAAVAVICAGARALEGARSPFLFIPVWAVCFVAVGLVSLWAVLGDAHPLRRGPVVFVLSPDTRGLLRLRRKCPPGWVDLHPPDHAAVPGGFTGVAARRAVVRLPTRSASCALHKSTGRPGKLRICTERLMSLGKG